MTPPFAAFLSATTRNALIHLAAESHVDRSILAPRDFLDTNVLGTFNLLESARVSWKDRPDVLFHHAAAVPGGRGKIERRWRQPASPLLGGVLPRVYTYGTVNR